MHGDNTSTAPVKSQQVVPPVQRQQQKDPAANPSQPARTSASTSSTMPASTTARCRFPACPRSAKYGPLEEPPIACQSHKKAGQFTVNRRGELLKATRDGDAFRTPAAVPAVVPPSPPASSSETAGTAAKAAPYEPRSTGGSGSGGGGGGSSAPSLRKTSAKPAPTAVDTLKRGNRPELSSGDAGSPASQNSLCLFPGCDALPTHGLRGALRAVYCFSHKKAAMVRVSENALDTQSLEGGETSITPAAVESKKTKARSPATATDRKGAKKMRRTPKVKEEGAGRADSQGGEHRVKSGGDGKATGRAEVEVEGSVKAAAVGDGGSRIKVDPSTSPSAATAPTTTKKKEEETATMQPPPPSPWVNRLADAAGMSPSAEFLVVKHAREAAKKEAEASGGGRRPRAPSRRALEASGRMKDEGAQWMSREKRAEQTRAKRELREQKRQYRAAGLSVGVVVEAYVASGTAAATGGGGGVVGGEGSRGGGAGLVDPANDESGWHKVSPALLTALPPPPKEEGKVAPVTGERPRQRAGSTAEANNA